MNRRYLIIGSSVVLVLLVILSLVVRTTQLYLASSTPGDDTKGFLPTKTVTFTFSKPMDPSVVTHLSISPAVPGKTTVSDKTVTFKPDAVLSASTDYTFTISNPTDTAGQHMSDVKLTFTTGYVPFSSLPKAQQQTELNNTDGIQKQFPVTQHLPQTALDYSITFQVDSKGSISYPVTLNVVPEYAGDPTYIPALKSAQAEALAWLRSVGADPATMNLIYNPNPDTGAYTPTSQ